MDMVTVFVGLDYHADSVRVCVMTEDGQTLRNRRVPRSLLRGRRLRDRAGPGDGMDGETGACRSGAAAEGQPGQDRSGRCLAVGQVLRVVTLQCLERTAAGRRGTDHGRARRPAGGPDPTGQASASARIPLAGSAREASPDQIGERRLGGGRQPLGAAAALRTDPAGRMPLAQPRDGELSEPRPRGSSERRSSRLEREE